jgi:hypothetical protein
MHQELYEIAATRRFLSAALGLVCTCSYFETEVDTHPAERLGLPSLRVMTNPWEMHEVGIAFEDQIAEGSSCKVRDCNSVAHIATCPAQAAGAI